MKKDFALAIPTPCHENWMEFAPTKNGGFCGSCQKEVIDFTTWSDAEIKNYFTQRKSATCGKFKPHQLKRYHETTQKRGWVPSLIAFALILLSRPAEAQPRSKARTEQWQKVEKRVVVGDTIVTSMAVRGIVLDDYEGSAIPGVNVVQKGTTNGTVTDAEGKFQLYMEGRKDNVQLVFSFIGFQPKEITLPRVSEYDLEVKLALDVSVLGGTMVGGVVALPWYSPRRWWWKVRGGFR